MTAPEVDPDECQFPPGLEGIAIRLVDEGVPVIAVARALRVESDVVREFLQIAISDGRLLAVTRDDWPPGTKRADRTPDHAPTQPDEDRFPLLCARAFKVTAKEARLLSALLRRSECTKEQLLGFMYDVNEDVPEIKIIDVFVCKLRKKLAAHALDIKTLWGRGYFITAEHRSCAIQLLEEFDAGMRHAAAPVVVSGLGVVQADIADAFTPL